MESNNEEPHNTIDINTTLLVPQPKRNTNHLRDFPEFEVVARLRSDISKYQFILYVTRFTSKS
jgi:hypothetical protein